MRFEEDVPSSQSRKSTWVILTHIRSGSSMGCPPAWSVSSENPFQQSGQLPLFGSCRLLVLFLSSQDLRNATGRRWQVLFRCRHLEVLPVSLAIAPISHCCLSTGLGRKFPLLPSPPISVYGVGKYPPNHLEEVRTYAKGTAFFNLALIFNSVVRGGPSYVLQGGVPSPADPCWM
jgi:hypothetical protein